MAAKEERGRGGMDWDFGFSRCKLLYIEWINNKVLLFSSGNYIQWPVINLNGKEHEKEYIYIYIYICCAHSLSHIRLFGPHGL